jgi:putative mycofactocin binding protein MftB
MEKMVFSSYDLAPGTQVREEDFGLLFYTIGGPRLYFLSSGPFLKSDFFGSGVDLKGWVERMGVNHAPARSRLLLLKQSLDRLKEKGVIIEC